MRKVYRFHEDKSKEIRRLQYVTLVEQRQTDCNKRKDGKTVPKPARKESLGKDIRDMIRDLEQKLEERRRGEGLEQGGDPGEVVLLDEEIDGVAPRSPAIEVAKDTAKIQRVYDKIKVDPTPHLQSLLDQVYVFPIHPQGNDQEQNSDMNSSEESEVYLDDDPALEPSHLIPTLMTENQHSEHSDQGVDLEDRG